MILTDELRVRARTWQVEEVRRGPGRSGGPETSVKDLKQAQGLHRAIKTGSEGKLSGSRCLVD